MASAAQVTSVRQEFYAQYSYLGIQMLDAVCAALYDARVENVTLKQTIYTVRMITNLGGYNYAAQNEGLVLRGITIPAQHGMTATTFPDDHSWLRRRDILAALGS